MIQLSDEQLNNLGKEALIVIVSSLQDQLLALQSQLDHANAQLSDNNRQIELLTEQIRLMNQRFFGRKSESAVSEVDGQLSLFDSFNEVEYLKQDPLKEPEITEVIIPSYRRKKAVGKRESNLTGLPARIIEHTLSDEELAVKFATFNTVPPFSLQYGGVSLQPPPQLTRSGSFTVCFSVTILAFSL